MNYATLLAKIRQHGAEMGGVFSHADLVNLIGFASPLAGARAICRLVKDQVVFRIQRGWYVTEAADLWLLAIRMVPDCYISMDSVLARRGLIGSVPDRSVSAVCRGRGRRVETPQGDITYYSLQPDLFFGVQRTGDIYPMADNEKAFLDLLYFYTKGHRFPIDPLAEIAIAKLDRTKVRRYLRRYRNPKFVAFVHGVIDART